jgi:hypothetical protein
MLGSTCTMCGGTICLPLSLHSHYSLSTAFSFLQVQPLLGYCFGQGLRCFKRGPAWGGHTLPFSHGHVFVCTPFLGIVWLDASCVHGNGCRTAMNAVLLQVCACQHCISAPQAP